MKIVDQTWEITVGDWIYRLREFDRGVTVSRVPIDHVLWNHGVIRQIYDRDAGAFRSGVQSGPNVIFKNREQARAVIPE